MKPIRQFWKNKPIRQLTRRQWDLLCARCGRCCVIKFTTPTSRKVQYTKLACRHLNIKTPQCRCYQTRRKKAPECVDLFKAPANTFKWLPESCAYRLLIEGRDLPAWHPLLTGDPKSTIKAGMSVAGHVVPEGDFLRPYPPGSQRKSPSRPGKASQPSRATAHHQAPG